MSSTAGSIPTYKIRPILSRLLNMGATEALLTASDTWGTASPVLAETMLREVVRLSRESNSKRQLCRNSKSRSDEFIWPANSQESILQGLQAVDIQFRTSYLNPQK